MTINDIGVVYKQSKELKRRLQVRRSDVTQAKRYVTVWWTCLCYLLCMMLGLPWVVPTSLFLTGTIMKQSKISSLVEVTFSTAVGYIISLIIQHVLNYAYKVDMADSTAAWFTFWFTLFSIIRSYLVRRLWDSEFWKKISVRWLARRIDPDLCCCGCTIGSGGDLCKNFGCRSQKERMISEYDNNHNLRYPNEYKRKN